MYGRGSRFTWTLFYTENYVHSRISRLIPMLKTFFRHPDISPSLWQCTRVSRVQGLFLTFFRHADTYLHTCGNLPMSAGYNVSSGRSPFTLTYNSVIVAIYPCQQGTRSRPGVLPSRWHISPSLWQFTHVSRVQGLVLTFSRHADTYLHRCGNLPVSEGYKVSS
jgi:hypothetical protein